MKFTCVLKAVFMINLLLLNVMVEANQIMTEVNGMNKLNSKNLLKTTNKSNLKSKNRNISLEKLNKAYENFKHFRFEDNEKMNKIKDLNLLLLNSEVLNAKP